MSQPGRPVEQNIASPKSDTESSVKPKKRWSLADIKQLWIKRTGVDSMTARLMIKGAIAPVIGMAAYQATPWANHFTTLGYLVPIITILSIPIMPRAKFVQNMIVNVLAVCLACCFVLLAMYCGVKAREGSMDDLRPGVDGSRTSGLAATGAQTAPYNSSASTVIGVWLFVLTYAIGVVRARMPQFVVPSVLVSIFVVVGMTYGPQFSTMTQAEAFATKLLETLLTGFGIATGVSLLILPTNSRQIAFKQMAGYLDALRDCVNANMGYVYGMETADMFAPQRLNTAGTSLSVNAETAAMASAIRKLNTVHAKLSVDITFAKREVALGNLGPDDIQAIFRLLREIMAPTTGLGSLSNMFERIADERGWDRSKSFANMTLAEAQNDLEKTRIETIQEWHSLLAALKEPFGRITGVIAEGLEHVAVTLRFRSPKERQQDESHAEEGRQAPRPGTREFPSYFDQCSVSFLDSKKTLLKAWCRLHDIELPPDYFSASSQVDFPAPAWMNDQHLTDEARRLRRQLFLCLYMEFLLYTISRRVYDLIIFAEGLRAHGKMQKRRLVVPGYKRLRKWIQSVVQHEAEGQDETIDATTVNTVYMGAAYQEKKDPEHLQPEGAWQKVGDQVRQIAHFFASPASAFGFRVACAVTSLGIINLLHDTQVFFTKNRLFWAMIMIGISMSPSAGQSLRNFMLRCVGTIIFYAVSLVAFYIVDGHTAGVLVFLGLFAMAGPYILLKHPAYTPLGMIGPITMFLIIGYELQVRKVGLEVAETNGQAYHPIYTLGLIRVATVCGGCFIAWIFTVFPYPITEHAQLRQSLGRSLYLMANYYSVTHESFRGSLRGESEDVAHRLSKARFKVFAKTTVLLDGLRTQMSFMQFDIPIGGRFPVEQYGEIIGLLQSMLNSMALVSIASSSFAKLRRRAGDARDTKWMDCLDRLVGDSKITSQSITTLLTLMSASISHGQALPPYLLVPEPAFLAHRLDELDRDILSARHIVEPGYAAFAVTQICMRSIVEDLRRVLELVKSLVGELDFSFHAVSTSDSSFKDSGSTLKGEGKSK